MARMFDNFGLGSLVSTDELFERFVQYVAERGKPIKCYYGPPYMPYLFTSMGNSEFWVQTEIDEDDKRIFLSVDTHCGGKCVWDITLSSIDITPQGSSKLRRTVMTDKVNGESSLIPVQLITADVLPSFLEGDKIKAQVIALPLWIEYYSSEEEYVEAQPSDENGERILPGNGSLLATEFLHNHCTALYEEGKEYETDDIVLFQATVSDVYNGVFEMENRKFNTFIRCFAETNVGRLEFEHSINQVPEEQRKNIKPGAIISGACIIQGDVAIFDYEEGFIKDYDHNLRLLRYTFVKGEAERLRYVLAEGAIYESARTGKIFTGREEIIDRIKYVHDNAPKKYYAHLAVITNDENPEHPKGTRCIVLAYGEENNYDSIVFLELNDSGDIISIKTSTDGSYHFRIEETYDTKPRE